VALYDFDIDFGRLFLSIGDEGNNNALDSHTLADTSISKGFAACKANCEKSLSL